MLIHAAKIRQISLHCGSLVFNVVLPLHSQPVIIKNIFGGSPAKAMAPAFVPPALLLPRFAWAVVALVGAIIPAAATTSNKNCNFMAGKAPYTLKKSLGQHFLKDDAVCLKIFNELRSRQFTRLLEVGPGGGALTRHLVQLTGIDFKAVELDTEKVNYLKAVYPVLQDKIIHEDFLTITPPFEGSFTIIGNFPYNISSQILFKAIDWKDQVECVIGMFQKEVAQRVASRPGSKVYGVTSVLVQAYFSVEYLFDVLPSSFNPPPKVMSGVIKMLPKKPFGSGDVENDTPHMRSDKHFKTLVKTAFNQRRKQLRNAVKGLFSPQVLQDEIFDKRAEQLSIHDFAMLTFKMN